MSKVNSFSSADNLVVGGKTYRYFKLSSAGGANLPFSLKILLENLLRTEDGANITAAHIQALVNWNPNAEPDTEIQFTPARVIMQDFTGVPCIVDLATMREAVAALGGDPKRINPLAPAEMVIDHSVVIDVAGRADAFEKNVELEYERNGERYQFLRWGQTAFDDFKVVPPGTGIVHQVNIEYLARTVMTREVDGVLHAYPDSCVGTDSHTTMVNGLGILGWGVGGIEAEAAMLGQPVSMLIPKVVGFKLTGKIPTGATATDVVLTITEMLRKHGVVGKFVEFYGAGVGSVPLANRATIGNMSPEFGSTVAIFPIDDVTLDYLRITGRSQDQIDLVEAYTKAQGLWHDPSQEPVFSEYLELDLSTVVPSIAGPKRPQDRIELSQAKQKFHEVLPTYTDKASNQTDVKGADFDIDNGIVSIASITSCTNTSNPSVMLAAGLLAQKAVAKGLKAKPWVKTSLAPGSKVVTEYYEKAGLTESLNALGFNLVGYGCTTCIGNSGPLDDA
ncbi:MAG: aconitate hydratase AcnA, partial [Rhodoluna sp.]